MKLSEDGLRLVKSFEGYHTRQPDGSCVAYLCPARVPTIGYGCTEGVTLGMRWTEAEAEAALLKEISKHEAAVARLVTVEINQNEFDALTSLSYNIGIGALSRSTVLSRLNRGDRAGAAQAFAMWNKGGGKVLPGLVSRRAREAALFLKPCSAPEAPFMAQKVEPTPEPVSRKAVAVVGTGVGAVASSGIPPPPPGLIESVGNVGAWKGLGSSAWADPLVLIAVAALAAIWGVPWALQRWRDA